MNHISTSYLRTIQQAIDIGTTLRGSWFRGHDETYKSLTPKIYRKGPFDRGGYREYWAAAHFRLRARAIEPKVPAWDEHVLWLLLMQHHGTPTRLLDWTESILTALYFALQGPADKAAEVWCIRPDKLNNLQGYFLCGPDRPAIRYLAAEVFLIGDEIKTFAEALKLSIPPKYPFAFIPPMEFRRMSAQSSRFTIHPLPTRNNTIECLLSDANQIVRYEIPCECKPSLSRDLTALGVTAELLFHSLDALSQTITEEIYDPDRLDSYPDPPSFT
jgi:hypothetical protein